jgi:flavin reductase (DIM6/NTAB) family NADH-FMN oxidoreductase RutF
MKRSLEEKKRNDRNEPGWIHLQEGKEFSRLLYANPVCFLCTHDNDKANVMIISWLTATNNNGRLMMSLNRRRHTAYALSKSKSDQDFTLCVPVAGMEDLVLAVGGTSGRSGSKFIETHPNRLDPRDTPKEFSHLPSELAMSKRQQKKLHKEQWAKGIPGLVKVPFGESENSCSEQKQEISKIFGIQGTVAHLHCRTYSVLEGAIDGEHYLILAEVIDAYCHVDYWESARKQFRPKPGAKPYLTFLGSQEFGAVTTNQNNVT